MMDMLLKEYGYDLSVHGYILRVQLLFLLLKSIILCTSREEKTLDILACTLHMYIQRYFAKEQIKYFGAESKKLLKEQLFRIQLSKPLHHLR